MNKGKSYSCFTSKTKPNHPLVKAFAKRGLNNLDFIYASHWASDAGWTVQDLNSEKESKILIGDTWWGFTMREAIANVEKAELIKTFGVVEFLKIK